MKSLFASIALLACMTVHAEQPISAVAVRNCGAVEGVFITLDTTHAVRFGDDGRAEYTVHGDEVTVTKGERLALATVAALAKSAVMQLTITVPCEHGAKGETPTAFHKVADTTEADEPIRAVMYEMGYAQDGAIKHAQVYGGYPSMEKCVEAMPSVMGLATEVEGKDGLLPQLECSGPKQLEHKHEVPKKDGTTDL